MPMPLIPQEAFDPTALDYEDMMTRVRTLAHQACPWWRDFSSNFPENVMLELSGLMANTIRITLEQRSRQQYWATVSEMLSVIRLGRANTFSVTGYTAATCTIRFALPGGALATKRILIQENLRARAQQEGGGPRYRVMAADEIAVGTNYVDVAAKNSEVQVNTYESTGEANQEIILPQSPYVDGSIGIIVNAMSWDLQASGTLTLSRPEDKHYVCRVDDDGRPRVVFGNDVNGMIPPRLATIEITHEIGDGTDGEVSAGATWLIEDTIYDETGSSITLVASNPADSSLSDSGTSIEEARVLGPLAATTRDTAVDEDDFENAAISISGIARAAMITSEQDSGMDEDYGILHLVARGSKLASGRFAAAAPTATQIAAVLARLSKVGGKRPLMLFAYGAQSAVFRSVVHSLKIYKAADYTAATVGANIRAAIHDFYAVSLSGKQPNTDIDFGYRLLGSDGQPDYAIGWGDLVRVIQSTVGVRRISHETDGLLLNGIRASVTLLSHEWPTPGAITIYDMDDSGVQI